jgi:transcription termination factor Rho
MPNEITGIVKRVNNQTFVLRLMERSLRPEPREIQIPMGLVRKFGLVQGASITGQTERQKGKIRVSGIDSICGIAPEAFRKRKPYPELVALDPEERFNLGKSGDSSMRMIDLIAPIGKGSRQLIVSPPKAGKTVMLEHIALAIQADSPESHIIVLLLDERPEEVTGFRRSVPETVDVLASTSDHTADEHAELAELVLSLVQTELECGNEVVLLIDSLTRVGRAFNNRIKGRSKNRGHTMSGGLEAGVLEIPRRLFGLARNVENSGSVTIIATCLINTGSRMDQLIFEEFKGTGNSEIILDRNLAESRIFPAVDIPASGTRKESRLYSEDESQGLTTLRRVLSSYSQRDAVIALQKLMTRYPTNQAFLESMTAGAAEAR